MGQPQIGASLRRFQAGKKIPRNGPKREFCTGETRISARPPPRPGGGMVLKKSSTPRPSILQRGYRRRDRAAAGLLEGEGAMLLLLRHLLARAGKPDRLQRHAIWLRGDCACQHARRVIAEPLVAVIV